MNLAELNDLYQVIPASVTKPNSHVGDFSGSHEVKEKHSTLLHSSDLSPLSGEVHHGRDKSKTKNETKGKKVI